MANEMMARVELLGCLTHSGRGRNFRKNKPQILTNAADIRYYQSQSIFSVTILSVERKKVTTQQTPVNDDSGVNGDADDDNDDDDDNGDESGAEFRYDDDDDDDDGDDEGADDGDDDEGDDSAADVIRYTLKDLVGFKKETLKEMARNLNLSDSGTVDELKSRIVKATKR